MDTGTLLGLGLLESFGTRAWFISYLILWFSLLLECCMFVVRMILSLCGAYTIFMATLFNR